MSEILTFPGLMTCPIHPESRSVAFIPAYACCIARRVFQVVKEEVSGKISNVHMIESDDGLHESVLFDFITDEGSNGTVLLVLNQDRRSITINTFPQEKVFTDPDIIAQFISLIEYLRDPYYFIPLEVEK